MTIRIGDCIKVIEPQEFVRCGYPMTIQDAKEKLQKDQLLRQEVDGLMARVALKHGIHYVGPGFATPIHSRIMSALGYLSLKMQDFGGNQRRIHTRINESLRGLIAEVTEKRRVMTGDYCSGSSSTSYDGEIEYEPAGLANARTHVILSCQGRRDGYGYISFEIEQVHVEKLTKVGSLLFGPV